MGFWDQPWDKCSRCGADKHERDLTIFNEPRGKRGRYAVCSLCLDEEARRTRIQPKLQELRKQIKGNRKDAEACYDLAQLLIPDTLRLYVWTLHYPEPSVEEIQEAYELLLRALRLGLSDPVQKANAYYDLWASTSWLSSGRGPIAKQPDADIAQGYLNMAEKELNVALSYEPDDEDMLRRLLVTYRRLGKDRKADAVVARMTEAKARRDIGLPLADSRPHVSSQQKGLAFEGKCMKWLQLEGFDVRSTSITGDGGVDAIAIYNKPVVGGTYVVQCKNWGKPVDEPTVRDLCGVVEKWKAVKGILISNSGFTSSAHSFAKGMRLELVDGHQLDYLLSSVTKKEIR